MPVLAIEIPWGPNITTIAGFLLTWHGFFTALGILIGVQASMWIARRSGGNEDDLYTLILIGIPAGIVGARGLFIIENWGFYGDNLGDILAITEGGISIWGALLAGILVPAAFGYWRGYDLKSHMDSVAFGLMLGLGIGRIGDLINGEHLATASDLPWAVFYTHLQSPALQHSFAVGAHHPATTYEMLAMWLVFAALIPVFFRRLYRYPGVTFMVIAAAYALIRFALTYLRVDSDEVALGLRVPQVVAIVTWLVVIPIGIYWLRRGPDEDRPEPHIHGRIPVSEPES